MRKTCMVMWMVGLIALVMDVRSAGAQGGAVTLRAALTGSAEVPGPGDPDGSGSATLELDSGAGKVCFELRATGIGPARAAHIHRGARGDAGPVVLGLTPPSEGSSRDCVAADRALIEDIARNPAGYYVNLHNAEFANGALRGQLGR
ncbi:MAG TPA: CHRD domain-containing protein [Gemmatimonadaceae bacterium]|nr:CHRD domain-containing protein [Gemmatimonadaceae bacterium]